MSKLALKGGQPEINSGELPAWPQVTPEDQAAVLDVLRSGEMGRLYPNSYAERFESAFARYHDAKHGVAVANGTVAIELALLAAGVRPGDEVLVPALTFIASAGAIVRIGAIPIFVDMSPGAGSISPEGIIAALTERTRAIVVVHYGGYPVDLDAISVIAHEHKLALIEDCAHAQGSEWKGRKVGAIGQLGTFSFQQSKALSSGEGGIVLTNDDEIAERAVLLHNIGRVPGKPGYEHYLCASNYRLGEFQSAVLLSALQRLPGQVARRHANGIFLADEFERLGGLYAFRRDERITQRGYYFMVLRYEAEAFGGLPRNRFIEALNAEGVPCHAAYGKPLYEQPAFKREVLLPLYPVELHSRLPNYEALHLPEVSEFCQKQVAIPHPVLLGDHNCMEKIVGAVAKIKKYAEELL